MKKILLLLFSSFFFGKWSLGQTVQGTLLTGSTSNRVIFAIKASAGFSASFSNVQFVLQIPNTASPIPTVSIVTNYLSGYIPTYNNSTVNSSTPIAFTNEGGYYNYLFSSAPTGQPAYNFPTTTTNVLEVQITGSIGDETVRFANLANGGSSGQHFFYIEANGLDYTNEIEMFYTNGNLPNNGGSYGVYSYLNLDNVTLPVQFTGFDVQCNDKGARLSWGTASEQNSEKFEIQRSKNGVDWIVIDNVAAAGNSDVQRNYQYLDLNGGTAFYRIRQVDKDGKFIYTAIKRTDCNINQMGITLYPVPASDRLTVVIKSDKAVRTDLQVVDINGRMVSRTVTQINQGNNNIVLDVTRLPAGQYMLTSSDPSIIINRKFTVLR